MNSFELLDKVSGLRDLIGKPTRLYSFWSLLNFSIAVYLGYWAIDFILFPRQNVPDPAGDVFFGYLLAQISFIFLLTWLASIKALRVWAPGIFLALLFLLMFGVLISSAFQGSFFAISILIMWIVAGLMIAMVGRYRVRHGDDPGEVVDDLFDAMWSKDMGQYRTLQELRRQNRLQEEIIEELRSSR